MVMDMDGRVLTVYLKHVLWCPWGPPAMAALHSPNYRGLSVTRQQLTLTDNLMTEEHAPYLFTGNSHHPSDPDQAGQTLREKRKWEY